MTLTAEQTRVDLAINSKDSNILYELMEDVSSRVRRAVARNKFSPKEVLNILIDDPVLNVSYMASIHKNCTKSKIFSEDTDHPCVCCNVKENVMECDRCKKPTKFRRSSLC